MSQYLFDRPSSHRAACKQWSAGLGVLILLIGALAGLNPTKMLWAAGPLLLLGLVEAGYAAQERRYAESIRRAQDPSKVSGLLPPEPVSASVVRTTLAALSLSIWPFYLGLFAIVGVGGEEMAASNKKILVSNGPPANYAPAGMVRTVASNGAGCGSGSCGTSAGCGSGGCGASAGKGCSCGGGAAPAQQMKRPVQPYMQTAAGPMAYQGGYPPMSQGQTMPRQGQMMPQQAQYQRLPNGAMVNARPPNMAANPTLARAMPGATPSTQSANSDLPSPNSAPPPAPSAVIDAPLQNAAPSVAPAVAPAPVSPEPSAAPATSAPAPAPLSKPAAPDAASKKKHGCVRQVQQKRMMEGEVGEV